MDSKNIWVLVEKRNQEIHPVVFELLSKSQSLKEVCGEKLVAVLFGEVRSEDKIKLEQYGAEEIVSICIDNETKKSYELIAELLFSAAREGKPSILLAGATAFGRTIMPLVAVKLKTGLTADCTELEVDGERKLLLQTRPAFGGNIMAVIECPDSKPQMATVRPHVFKPHKSPNPKKARVTEKRYKPVIRRISEVMETIVEEEKIDITQADVIVSGGRGLGKPEGFELLQKLAGKLGGVVGASRGAVDLGWINSVHQVGQTGHTVSPKLYVACGISGAVQHLAGMKSSDTIIAINMDPEASIFEVSDYGIVGDLYNVIPRILEEMEREDGS